MSDIRASLARALQSATGRPAKASEVDVLAAQVSLETAHGASMYNYNFGGIKGASPEGATAHYLTHEVVGGSTVTVDQGFRAYSSLDAGARDYVSVMQARFPQALAHASSGDVDGFAHALKQAHYYTAPEGEYASGLRSAYGNVSRPASTGAPSTGSTGAVASSTEFSDVDAISRVLDAVASSSARIAAPDPRT